MKKRIKKHNSSFCLFSIVFTVGVIENHCFAQDFTRLFQDAVFTKRVELGVPGSVCIVSQKGNPIAVMWRWWEPEIRLKLSPNRIRKILGTDINLTHIKVLDRKGNPITKGTQNGLIINLGTEPRYLIVNKDYTPPLACPDDLSNVRAYVIHPKSLKGHPLVVFDKLTKQITIQLYNSVGQLVTEIKNPDKPKIVWKCLDRNGEKVPPGKYVYKITGKGGAVAGQIRIDY